MAALTALFDRLGRHEPAATIAGFAFSPLTALATPEINTAITHLRDVLGDQTYESLARKGETMTTTEMVDLRIRPNRPGPSRTERCLEIEDAKGHDLLVTLRLGSRMCLAETRIYEATAKRCHSPGTPLSCVSATLLKLQP